MVCVSPSLIFIWQRTFADKNLTDPTYLAGHAAAVYLRVDGEAKRIGAFGILHPKVLQKFELPFPTSALEINVEVFL